MKKIPGWVDRGPWHVDTSAHVMSGLFANGTRHYLNF